MARPRRIVAESPINTSATPKVQGGNGKRGRGQPTKYRPEYCDKLIDHMKEGGKFGTFCAVIGVADTTVDKWVHDYEEFSATKREAVKLAELWWERLGRRIANGTGPIMLKKRVIKKKTVPVMDKKGNVTMVAEENITESYGPQTGNTGAWVFNMINRFPKEWKQRLAIGGTEGGDIPIKGKINFEGLDDTQLEQLREIALAAEKSGR